MTRRPMASLDERVGLDVDRRRRLVHHEQPRLAMGRGVI